MADPTHKRIEVSTLFAIHYLHKSHNTHLLPPPPPPPKKKKKKNLHRHCFRLLLGHFHVPGEIANNGYANALGSNRGVLWDCARSEFYFRFFCLDFIYFNSKEDKLLRIILKINWYERFQSKNIE